MWNRKKRKNKPTSIMEILNNEIETCIPKVISKHILSSAKENADIIEFLISQEKECVERLQKLRDVYKFIYHVLCIEVQNDVEVE